MIEKLLISGFIPELAMSRGVLGRVTDAYFPLKPSKSTCCGSED